MRRGLQVRHDAVFLDVDGTLWVHLDVEGYVKDLAPYATNGSLTVERAKGPVREGLRRHIEKNIEHRTEEDLAGFKRRNAEITASALAFGLRRTSLLRSRIAGSPSIPTPSPRPVLRRLREMGVGCTSSRTGTSG